MPLDIEVDPQETIDQVAPEPPPSDAPLWQVPKQAWTDFVTALGALSEPPKTGKVHAGMRKYTYLTLPDLIEAVRPVFAAHRLAFSQEATIDQGMIVVHTVIFHTSGARWDSPPLVMPCGRTPQDIGSALTYARRYQLATMVGLAGADDDDAQTVQHPREELPPVDPETGEILEPESSAPGQQNATGKQLTAIGAIGKKAGLERDDIHALAEEITGRPDRIRERVDRG